MRALVDELTNDPEGLGYAGKSDQACADLLNAKNRTRVVPIPSTELLAWSGGGADDQNSIKSRYERMEDGAAAHSSLAVKGICKAAVKLIDRDATALDLSLPDRAAMVDVLVAGEIITASEQAELEALGTETISRAEELKLGRVVAGTVQRARAYDG